MIAVASSASKLAAAKARGAVAVIESTREDMKQRVHDLTGGHLVDVLYDVVGGELFERCISVMAGGGRMLVVGFTSGQVQRVAANLLLVKGISVLGVRAGADMQRQPQLTSEMNERLVEITQGSRARSLAPVIDLQVDAEHFAQAYRRLATRAVIGKATVAWKEEALHESRASAAAEAGNAAADSELPTLSRQ